MQQDAMARATAFMPALAPAGLVVLTRDPALVEGLRAVIDARHRFDVVEADTALTDQLMASSTRTALIDSAACTAPVAQLTERLKAQFPDLVLVVTGTAADQGALAPQITDGGVYRFLHKPVSAQRLKLFVESAFRHSDAVPPTLPRPEPARPAGGSRLPLVAIGLALAIVAAIAIWWLMREPAGAPAASPVPATDARRAAPAAPGAPSDLDPATQRALERANEALTAGELVMPPGESAADLYKLVLTKSPGNAQALAGLDAIVGHLLGDAEQAIVAEQLDEATRLVDTARGVRADHPRIAFLTTQIGKERERQLLTAARQAAASGNLGRAISVLESGSATGSELIGAARRELQQQEIDLQATNFLALAAERIRSGALVDPAQDNARFYIESARALAPEHAGLRDAERRLQVAIVAQTRATLDSGDTAAAGEWIATAESNGVARSELAELRRELQAAQIAHQAEAYTALAQRFDEELRQHRLLQPAATGARALYEQMRAADAQHPRTLAARDALGAAMLDEARIALARADATGAERWAGEAAALGLNGLALTNVRRDIATLRARERLETEAIPVGRLTRVRTVEPRYPSAAAAAGQTGWVDLEFTVNTSGGVENMHVTDASPAGVFDEAATDAVARWRFKPVERNGVAVPQRVKLRLRFDLQ